MKFSLVIPTYKRPDSLKDTLESVLANSQLPDEVLIIDDDTLPEGFRREMEQAFMQKGSSFLYYKKNHDVIRRGLSESKNWAVTLVANEIIFYLDDDVVLEPNYFYELMKVWEENWTDNSFVGAGGRILNNRKTGTLEKIYRSFFGLSSNLNWDVNDVGFQVWDESVSKTEKAYYIHGGVSSYRKTFLENSPFETFSGGRTGLEDVEHCLRTKKAGNFFYYVPSASLYHYPKPVGREHAFISGKKEALNRKAIFYKHCTQDFWHKIRFAWANLGWVLKKIISGRWREVGGMVNGWFS